MKFLKIAVSNTGNSNDGKLLVSWYYTLKHTVFKNKTTKIGFEELVQYVWFQNNPITQYMKSALYQYN